MLTFTFYLHTWCEDCFLLCADWICHRHHRAQWQAVVILPLSR